MIRFAAAVLMCLLTASAEAQDVYLNAPIEKLAITLAGPADQGARVVSSDGRWRPYVVLDNQAECYLWASKQDNHWDSSMMPHLQIAIRAKASDKEITGTLFVPSTSEYGGQRLPFKLAAADFTSDKKTFLQAKRGHYRELANAGLPGAAWFQYQYRTAASELGEKNPDDQRVAAAGRDQDIDDTFSLFSGNRAIDENLQLDRALAPTTQAGQNTVDVSKIPGITINEMKWDDLIKGLNPQLDPLASLIPADQHAVFFPSFNAMVALMDAAQQRSPVLLQNLESVSEDALTQQRYERQLGLSLSGLGRLLGPQLVNSVAITGSDPYLRAGSDIAIIFETSKPEVLDKLLDAQARLLGEAVAGKADGVAYSSVVSTDQSVRCYRAVMGNAVIVTNSLPQLRRIVAAQSKQTPALASLPEYIYFRDRYKRGDASETALLVLSDATIRRWCGPRWRIADSRRTRAATMLTDQRAQHAMEILQGQSPDTTSPIYGSLEFMTPIIELEMTHVTQAEADAYGRWRETYQENWRWAFDPIACRISVDGVKKFGFDLTVTPLIMATDYKQFLGVTLGSELKPSSGDPHADAIAHAALAINHDSGEFKSYGNLLQIMGNNLKIEPLAWIDSCVALYADDDPFWAELAAAKEDDNFLEKNFQRLPVALYVESRDPLRLAAFLTALRAYVDQAAPNLTKWETQTYHDKQYVKITAAMQVVNDQNTSIYYTALPKALVVSLSETMIQRALDRLTAPTSQPADAWLGKNLALRLTPKFHQIIEATTHKELVEQAQQRAWANIPILNEWKQLSPDKDPIQMQQRIFGVRLIDPAGGNYVWNEKWHTMESPTFGHFAEPKEGPVPEEILRRMKGSFGVTFENNGLRGRMELEETNSAEK